MKKKNILLIIKKFKEKEEDFFNSLKSLMDEKGQNNLIFYRAEDKGLNGALDVIKKEKVDIVAAAFDLPKSFLETIKTIGIVSIAVNLKQAKNYDLYFNTDYNDDSLVSTCQKLSIADKLNWDTDFFGVNIAKFNHEKINENAIKLVLKWCGKNKIKCLYYTASGKDLESIRLAEKYGFSFVNIRVTYALDSVGAKVSEKSELKFRKAKKGEIPELIKMSKKMYIDSKYYFDQNFPDKLCDKFYSTWIKKIAFSEKKDDNIYVLEKGGKLAAYIASGVEHGKVFIFLVGVDSSCRGQGVGKLLLSEFIREQRKFGFKEFQVVTQGRNIAALRLYQSHGFKIVSEQIEYHKWF